MGFYAETAEEDYGVDMDALVESFLIDDLTHNYSDETIKEFCAPGGVADALLEAKVLSNKRSVMRLSKEDDERRRLVITCLNMAKAKNDPLYHKLVKYQVLRKQTKAKLVQKYGSRANRAAMKGQKQYIKAMRGVNISNNLSVAGAEK